MSEGQAVGHLESLDGIEPDGEDTITVYLRMCRDGAWLGSVTSDSGEESHEAFRSLPNAKRWGAQQLQRKRVRWSESVEGKFLTASRVFGLERE